MLKNEDSRLGRIEKVRLAAMIGIIGAILFVVLSIINMVVYPGSFHVHYHSKGLTTSLSTVGLKIASALKEFGLVHHSVWSEEKSKEKS